MSADIAAQANLGVQWETLWALRGRWITPEHFSLLIMLNKSLLIASANRESCILRCYIWLNYVHNKTILLNTHKTFVLVLQVRRQELSAVSKILIWLLTHHACGFFFFHCFCMIILFPVSFLSLALSGIHLLYIFSHFLYLT